MIELNKKALIQVGGGVFFSEDTILGIVCGTVNGTGYYFAKKYYYAADETINITDLCTDIFIGASLGALIFY